MPNKCSCEHDSAKKGEGRRQRSRSPAPRKTSDEKQYAKKTGQNSCGKEDRPPFRSYKKGTCGCDTECAFWHFPAQKTLQDEEPPIGKGLSLRPLPKRKIVPHILKEEVKEKGLQQKGLQLLCE